MNPTPPNDPTARPAQDGGDPAIILFDTPPVPARSTDNRGKVTVLIGALLLFALTATCAVYSFISIIESPNVAAGFPLVLCGAMAVASGYAAVTMASDLLRK